MHLFLFIRLLHQYIDDESIFLNLFINILYFYTLSESFFYKNFSKIHYKPFFCTKTTDSDSPATARKTFISKSKAKNEKKFIFYVLL